MALGAWCDGELDSHIASPCDAVAPALYVAAHIEAADRRAVVETLARALTEHGVISDRRAFCRDVLDREDLGETVVAPEVALPHGVSSSARRFGIALATLGAPIRWGDGDEAPSVRIVALFAVPEAICESNAEQYIDALGELADVVDDEGRRAELCACGTSEELGAALSQFATRKGEIGQWSAL